ncbi:MAG: hypothetical protein HQK53_06085 [Oligoflexia bacterium]|nr:hypothetical protein [Oligoflexia bacterium]
MSDHKQNPQTEKMFGERSLEEIIVNGCILWMERDSRQLCIFGNDGSERNISISSYSNSNPTYNSVLE